MPRETVVGVTHSFEIGPPDSDGDTHVHVLRALAFQQVGFLQRLESEEIKGVVAIEIDHGIEFVGVVAHGLPKFFRHDVLNVGVDVAHAGLRRFVEIADQYPGRERRVIGVLGGEGDCGVGAHLVQGDGGNAVVERGAHVLRDSRHVGADESRRHPTQILESIGDLVEMHGFAPPVTFQDLHGHVFLLTLFPVFFKSAAFL